jgi:hypothetical protein
MISMRKLSIILKNTSIENPSPIEVGKASQWDGSKNMIMIAKVRGLMMG